MATASEPGSFRILMARFAALYFGCERSHARKPCVTLRGRREGRFSPRNKAQRSEPFRRELSGVPAVHDVALQGALLQLLFEPRVHALLENIEWQGTATEQFVMECADVEFVTQREFGTLPDGFDL